MHGEGGTGESNVALPGADDLHEHATMLGQVFTSNTWEDIPLKCSHPQILFRGTRNGAWTFTA